MAHRFAIGARGQLSYAEETDWGKAKIPTQRLNFRTESLKNELAFLVSEAQDPSRSVTTSVLNTSNVNGDFVYEQNTQGFETLYKHAFGDHVTMAKTDGGVRAHVTGAFAGGAGDLIVDSTNDFEGTPSTDWGLYAVYKDSDDDLITVELTYTALTATSFALDDALNDPIPQGAWIFQEYIGADDFWDEIYTHYIEAARVLPQGLTFEVGRDVAFFVYEGMKINTLENTFTNQEMLLGTVSMIGKTEFVGATLVADIDPGDTSFQLEGFELRNSANVSADVFSGAGLNDATAGGTFSGTVPTTYIVKITSNGTPDKFKWSNDGGVTWSIEINVDDTPAIAIGALGVTILWTATTGHTIDDRWYIQTGDIVGFKFGSGVVQMEAENDITYTAYNAYNGIFTGIPASSAGSIAEAHLAGLPVAPQTSWGTPADPPDTEPLSSFQAALYLNGSSQEVLSATWTLNNNLFADKFQLGSRVRAGLTEQKRAVEGSLNIEFDDTVMYHDYLAGRPAMLEIRCVDANNRIDGQGADPTPTGHSVYSQETFILPKIKYNGTTPNVGGPDQIVYDMPFMAFRDAANDMNEIAAIFVNERATI